MMVNTLPLTVRVASHFLGEIWHHWVAVAGSLTVMIHNGQFFSIANRGYLEVQDT